MLKNSKNFIKVNAAFATTHIDLGSTLHLFPFFPLIFDQSWGPLKSLVSACKTTNEDFALCILKKIHQKLEKNFSFLVEGQEVNDEWVLEMYIIISIGWTHLLW